MQILKTIKCHKKVLSKSSINQSRSSPSSRLTSVSSSFSDSLSSCSSPSLSSSSSFWFSQYSIFSQLPAHLQRSVHSNDNILHWQSSTHKACRQLQVMSYNMDSGDMDSYASSRHFPIFSHYLASHVRLENPAQSWCSKLASKQAIDSWLVWHVAVTHLLYEEAGVARVPWPCRTSYTKRYFTSDSSGIP